MLFVMLFFLQNSEHMILQTYTKHKSIKCNCISESSETTACIDPVFFIYAGYGASGIILLTSSWYFEEVSWSPNHQCPSCHDPEELGSQILGGNRIVKMFGELFRLRAAYCWHTYGHPEKYFVYPELDTVSEELFS